MDFRGAARPLTNGDIAKAAKLLRVPEHVIWALRKVEANGKAFSDGRPIVAWEAHVFFRRLPQSKRARAVAARLAHSKWGVISYKLRQSSRYEQIHNALAIDVDAALESASWGSFQIMGFNWKRCGYDSVQAFVQAMTESEGEQLIACCHFIRADRTMHKAMRDGNWAGFAKRYNGPGYAKHDYDGRLMKWVSHFAAKGAEKRLKTEVARRETAPKDDPSGARQEGSEAIKDAGRIGIGVTGLLAMASEWAAEMHFALDEAIEKLSGVKGMAPWVETALVVLVSVSAISLFIHIMRRRSAKKETADVVAG